ncbi:uncharacterized protein LAESUDRAFT_756338 [Laetiporus sulphureus 93-53]|uniref:Uncharacterized protein n=1 Tax=Laetiporus sulphureus 93-53 TaxID=1314785 RepID=A0A165GCA2_9APHY|nr:uncharacterized protein LAESUDRAFT_756338 [Laetiporus sulphureus 93-53]KZT10149.1 hypothetical protein LAESUDRAFT_756338 [Laetiporus sulphureus 93-53]
MTTWIMKSKEDVLKFAEEWRDAQTKTRQAAIFRKTGVRWSELLRLPYWDPTRGVIVDSMHNLFLGLVQYHVHTIIGMDILIAEKTMHDAEEADSVGEDETDDVVIIQEAAKIEKMLTTNPTVKKLQRKPKQALRLVCHMRGIEQVSWGGTKRLKEKVVVEVLMESVHSATSLLAMSTSAPNKSQPMSDVVVGQELVDELAVALARTESVVDDSTRRKDAEFCQRDLRNLQDDIALTVCPMYSSGPPRNIGTKARGKLKADHWKAAIEFEIPVSFMKRWCHPSTTAADHDNPRQALACTTMLLACAVGQVTSYPILQEHKDKYTAYMSSYLSEIRRLCPDRSL